MQAQGPPTGFNLECGLQLADFENLLYPFSESSLGIKEFGNFKNYGSSYYSKFGLAYSQSSNSQSHFLYAGWYPTGSFTSPYDQKIFQFVYSSSEDTTVPEIADFTPFTSSINTHSFYTITGETMGSGLPAALFFQTIQLPPDGGIKVHFAAQDSSRHFVLQYNLSSQYDITTLLTASRQHRQIRNLTGSNLNIAGAIKQTSYGYTGSHLYQITTNSNGNDSPYPTWTILTVFELSTQYDLGSSGVTSSYILENELGISNYNSAEEELVNVSKVEERYDGSLDSFTSSFYYTNKNTNVIKKFRINRDRSLSNVEQPDLNAFPMQINYVSPVIYADYSDVRYENFAISNSLAPESSSGLNENRTGSCLAPYSIELGNIPV